MSAPAKFRIGKDYFFRPSENTLESGKGVQSIEPLLSSLMLYLMTQAPKVVTHEELIEKFWGPTVKSSEVMMKTISKVRKLFAIEVIKTVSKVGYSWVAPFEASEDSMRFSTRMMVSRFNQLSPATYAFLLFVLLIIKAIVFPHQH